MKPVSSWGRLTAPMHRVVPLNCSLGAKQVIRNGPLPGLAFGKGRSYGDVCLNPDGLIWTTSGMDRFISFDEGTGRLVCETGVSIRDIQQLFIPRGWTLPVTPGTQFVTVGGAIANDIHGKNHHKHGTFGDHVLHLKLARTDGEIIECGPSLRSEWFAATVGGLGLTGIILEAELQLHRTSGPWLDTETISYASLEEFFQLADDSELNWEHTVSWIDCLAGNNGQGLFMRGNPSNPNDLPAPAYREYSIPFAPPLSLVNRMTLRPFNLAYYHLKKRQHGLSKSYYKSFFYPLDHLYHWNRMYGPRGFYQYQCVVPRSAGTEPIKMLLSEITHSGTGSFLAVLKTFGNRQAPGLLSFPQPGSTLALDFPNQGQRTLSLLDRLDAIVRAAQGRIYPAKDARMSPSMFGAGYPRLEEFRQYRDSGISSGFSRRLMGE